MWKGKIKEIPPGICVYWPIIAELELVNITERTTQMCGIFIDGELYSAMINWEIIDAVKTLCFWRDIAAHLDNAAQASLFCHKDKVEKIRMELQGRYEGAVKIHRVCLLSQGPILALKMINDWGRHEKD